MRKLFIDKEILHKYMGEVGLGCYITLPWSQIVVWRSLSGEYLVMEGN